jgi:hypothetical protein
MFCNLIFELNYLITGQRRGCEFYGSNSRLNFSSGRKAYIPFIKKLLIDIINSKYFDPEFAIEYVNNNTGVKLKYTLTQVFMNYSNGYKDLIPVFNEKNSLSIAKRYTDSKIFKKYNISKLLKLISSENDFKNFINNEFIDYEVKDRESLVNNIYKYIKYNYSLLASANDEMFKSLIFSYTPLELISSFLYKEFPKFDERVCYLNSLAKIYIENNSTISYNNIKRFTDEIILPYGYDLEDAIAKINEISGHKPLLKICNIQ